jgi:hypothetical protein
LEGKLELMLEMMLPAFTNAQFGKNIYAWHIPRRGPGWGL